MAVYNKDKAGNQLTIEQMIRKFKKELEKEGKFESLKRYEYFESKSVRKRRKRLKNEHMRLIKAQGKKKKH